jgi:threonine dehydrogenase-like Zn-dependent dehydrogenase
VWTEETIPDLRFHAAVDASSAPQLPARAIELVEPGHRVSLIGIAGQPSQVDTRDIIFGELTVVGVLSASGGLAEAIERLASRTVDARPLVAATVGLDEVAPVLAGERDPAWGNAPKIQVDPRR